ncbi:PREDICTED: uncharacterized protein LOC105977001 [Erythranthe guttata]|uniref:uncharacterized protein LOC105977001 n=1 Tax=Erythranthe guttata TaxID=4155 RepID=UPI00064DCBB0|nr:PREDICTED: uncharacterized protein LOC105977001 [Erythranthe guttata]|eukprot:XP_012857718.1 PREDICTED: uncharacterized protein LOC105977001 [Erythranthe guttata]
MVNNSKGFYFPCLVTGLCKKAKVPTKTTDIFTSIRKPMSNLAARQYKAPIQDGEQPVENQPIAPPEGPSTSSDRRFQRRMERELVITRNRLATVEHKVSTIESLQRWSGKMLQAIVRHLACGNPECAEPAPLPAPILEPVPELSDDEEDGDAHAQGGVGAQPNDGPDA